MVFLTQFLNVTLKSKHCPGPHKFWKRQKILRMSAHFYGRKRQCYSIACRYVHRALVYATKARQLKYKDMTRLWEQRITAACAENNIDYQIFCKMLKTYDVFLSRKVLADIAVYEPRTFKSLATFAWNQAKQKGLPVLDEIAKPPPGVFTRGMFVRKADNI